MKNIIFRRILLTISFTSIFFICKAQLPTILINGNTALASEAAQYPYWLSAGATLEKGNKVIYISVLQFNINPLLGGGKELQFDSIILVSGIQTVPANKAWKVEAVITDSTILISGGSGGGDNWGGQTVVTDSTLTGLGTGSSNLSIAQQGASAGQVLQWDGTAWYPATFVSSRDSTLKGNGTSGNPLGLAQQGATSGQVLQWNGSSWVPGDALTARYFLGDYYGGGIVVYVDSTKQHGLIAAKTNQSSSIQWFQNTTTTTNAQSFTDGQANTTAIITAGASASAANLCDNYTAEGYSDWYLPAAYELILICRNQGLFANYLFYTVGADACYWTSTENPSNPASRAVGMSFGACLPEMNDNSYNMQKTATYKVRCVRKF